MSYLKVGLCPALTTEACVALKDSGLQNVADFVAMDMEKVAKETGISYKDLLAIRRVALAQYSSFPVNGHDLYEDIVGSVAILSTGCSIVDELLDGGLYTAEVTEVIGGAATGKTQLCLNASLAVATGTQKNVLYMDTSGSFDINRLQDILEARGTNQKATELICSRILCCQVFDIFELLSQLENIKSSLNKQSDAFYNGVKLLIVDSVTSVISPVLGGAQSDGHGFMMHLSRLLKCLALDHSVAVLITNNVVYDERGQTRAALGRAWQAVPKVRLELSCDMVTQANGQVTRSPKRNMSLCKSTRQVVGRSIWFYITDKGLQETTKTNQ